MNNSSDTRTAILDVTQDMIQRKSLSGVSFQEIADRIGIKKGSMYYHFKSKETLLVAMFERAGLDLKHSFSKGQGKSASQRLEYFLAIYSDYLGVGEKLCPVGASAAQWEKLPEAVREQISKLVAIQLHGVQAIIGAGIASGEFVSHQHSEQALALWLVTTLQGALLTARVMGNRQAFDISFSIIRLHLQKK
jgi:TetR/AcrR family transcriptional repressor of nem operon